MAKLVEVALTRTQKEVCKLKKCHDMPERGELKEGDRGFSRVRVCKICGFTEEATEKY